MPVAIAERAQIKSVAKPPNPMDHADRYELDFLMPIKDMSPNLVPEIIPIRQPETEKIDPIKNLLIPNRAVFLGEALRSALDAGIPKITAMIWKQDQFTAPVQYALGQAKKTPGRVEVVFVGENAVTPSDVYSNTDLILETAKEYGCDRVDLGWGFLAENHKAIAKMEQAELISVGPTSEQIRRLGNKVNALRVAEKAKVPTLRWVDGANLSTWDDVKSATQNIRYPIMMKANESGSGRGIKIVTTMDELKSAWEQNHAMFENNGGWHITQILPNARHFEVQIMGDKYGKVIALGERECSVQEERQKRVEESAILSPEQRDYLDKAAIAIAQEYQGAGTVEFLMDEDGKFYFMEVNTRLQVEHPVTEGQTGVDIIATRYRTTEGFSLDESAIKRRTGHIIEFRLCAETGGFIEDIGLSGDDMPSHVRVDLGYSNGSFVPNGVEDGTVDELVALFSVSGYTRKQAIARMIQSLESVRKHHRGKVKLNIDKGLAVMRDPDFIANTHTIQSSEDLHKAIMIKSLQKRMKAVWDPGREAA